jgi:Tol biopolymer transport system component
MFTLVLRLRFRAGVVAVVVLLALLAGPVSHALAQGVQNGRIAFQSNRDHQPFCCQIVTMNADGSDIRPLLRNFEDSWDPAWSPDGSRIAFASLRGHFDLFTAGADGRNVQRLTKSQKARDSSPAWSPMTNLASPMTNELAFVSTIDGNFDIFRIGADGTNVVNLTRSADANDCGCFDPFLVFAQPAFSPDGRLIAFSSDLADPGGNLDIYLMDRNGSNIRRLTTNAAIDAEPDWSPDGTTIAFQSKRDGDMELYLMKTDGALLDQLTHNSTVDIQPDWSPDGTKIAFISNADGFNDVWVIDPDRSHAANLTNDAASDERPDWQPVIRRR